MRFFQAFGRHCFSKKKKAYKIKYMAIRLPPANYGSKAGTFDWKKPVQVWKCGYEVTELTEALPTGRVVSLNSWALGEALAYASIEAATFRRGIEKNNTI